MWQQDQSHQVLKCPMMLIRFMLPSAYRSKSILSDAKISQNNELILRTAENKIIAFIIPPTSFAQTSIFSSIKRFFVASDDEHEVQNTQPKVLNIAWLGLVAFVMFLFLWAASFYEAEFGRVDEVGAGE